MTSDSGNKSGTITLTVWDFTLPLQPSLQSSFGFWTPYQKQNSIELLKNKLMPKNVDLGDQEELITDWGLNNTDLGFWSGADISTCTMEPPPSVRDVSRAVRQIDPSLLIYNYTADEISECDELNDDVIAWSERLHKGGSNQLIVMIPDPALFDNGLGTGRSAVDIWSVQPLQYLENTSVVNQALKAGQQVWAYSALFQTEGNVPVWLIDFDPMNFRIPGLINQSTRLNGLLYWSVDYGIYAGASEEIWRHGYDYVNGDIYHFPGEGTLFYPGEEAGIASFCPSMRLKWLRDGIEDYEYVEILKRCGLGTEAKQIIALVAANWDRWSKDVAALFSVRRQLAEKILQNGCDGE